jgi:hypothetical protein
LKFAVTAVVAAAPAVRAREVIVACSKVPHKTNVPGFGAMMVTAPVRTVPVAAPAAPKATAVFLSAEFLFSLLSLGPWTRNWRPECLFPSR